MEMEKALSGFIVSERRCKQLRELPTYEAGVLTFAAVLVFGTASRHATPEASARRFLRLRTETVSNCKNYSLRDMTYRIHKCLLYFQNCIKIYDTRAYVILFITITKVRTVSLRISGILLSLSLLQITRHSHRSYFSDISCRILSTPYKKCGKQNIISFIIIIIINSTIIIIIIVIIYL